MVEPNLPTEINSLTKNVQNSAKPVSKNEVTLPYETHKQLVSMFHSIAQLLEQTIKTNTETHHSEGDNGDNSKSASDALSHQQNSDDELDNFVVEVGEHSISWERVAVRSEEEIARTESNEIKVFDDHNKPGEKSHDFGVDSWNTLEFSNWSRYSRFYTFGVGQLDLAMESQTSLSKIIRHYKDNPQQRILTQKRLFCGLSRWWWSDCQLTNVEQVRENGTLDMGSWVALIGMRLPQYCDADNETNNKMGRDMSVKILLQLVQLPHVGPDDAYAVEPDKEANFWAEEATLGQLLDYCYRQRILKQPEHDDFEGYKLHVRSVKSAFTLINLWEFMGNFGLPDSITSVEEIRCMKLSEVYGSSVFSDLDADDLPKTISTTFQSKELCLEVIQGVGKLRVKWTEFLDEHLKIDVDELTIKIFWFGFAVKATPVFHIGCGLLSQYAYCHSSKPRWSPLVQELGRTYSLLFRSQKERYDDNLHAYGQLPIPLWLRVFHGTDKGMLPQKTAKNMAYFLKPNRTRVTDVDHHIEGLNIPLPPSQLFEKYRIWGDRLREIKAHMDNQKPKGIRGLWADKRDTLQWYTFWAVIIVGSVTLLLAVLGLAISTAQTVAAFKALKPPRSRVDS